MTEFFLSGRKMPWWLLGISMVATTFSADTPNLVTDIVRTNGVAGIGFGGHFYSQECLLYLYTQSFGEDLKY